MSKDWNSLLERNMSLSPLKLDPAKLVSVRNQFLLRVKQRFVNLSDKIRQETPWDRPWWYNQDSEKLKSFQDWMKELFDIRILGVTPGDFRKPWIHQFIEKAYRQGIIRSYNEIPKKMRTEDYEKGDRERFQSSLLQGDKISLLTHRAFEQFKGASAHAVSRLSRVFTRGLTTDLESLPEKLQHEIDITHNRCRQIVRTELVHSHAEGQLDAFQALGVGLVTGNAEVPVGQQECKQCAHIATKVYTIKEARGIIPVHPECCCVWRKYTTSGNGYKPQLKNLTKNEQTVQVFGYGSDLCLSLIPKHLSFQTATLEGWTKQWSYRSTDRDNPEEKNTDLNIIPSDSGSVLGLLFTMTEEQLQEVMSREDGYQQSGVSIDGKLIDTFTADSKHRHLANKDFPIWLSYLDCVLLGAHHFYGFDGVQKVIESLGESPIYNDRDEPDSKKAIVLTSAEQRKLDWIVQSSSILLKIYEVEHAI
jgi:hypothetical protein